MEAVVLHRVGFLAYFCPKQGQDFKPSAAPLYPNMGQVPPRGDVLPRTSRAAMIIACVGKKNRDTTVSDFVQKHFVSATNISQLACARKRHEQQCFRNNVSSSSENS